MKILLLISTNDGTIAKVSYNLYLNLKKRKDVDLYVINFNATIGHGFVFDNCFNLSSKRQNNIIFRQFNNIYKLFKYIILKNRLKPSLTISTQELCTTISILSFGNDKKYGVFHSPHFQAKSQGKLSYYLQYFSYLLLYNKLNKIICVSEEVKISIMKIFHITKPHKVQVIYNLHDFNNIFHNSIEPISDIELTLFRDYSIILYIGRLDKNKAPDRLLKSFSKLYNRKSNILNYKLVFIGIGDIYYTKYLNNLVEELNLQNNVVFLGYKSNPYPYLLKSKLLISTSFSEGLPGVLIEALYLNIPIIATNSSIGIWEILSEFENYNSKLKGLYSTKKGIIVQNQLNNEFDNINYLSIAIQKIIDNDDYYQTLIKSEFSFYKLLDNDLLIHKYLTD